MSVHRAHHKPGLTAADKRGNAVIASALKLAPLAEGGLDQPAVKWMERMLALAGFKAGAADNHFGANTTEALEQFQASVGLPATGQLDARTFAKLEAVELRIRQHGKDEFFGAGQAGKQVQDAEKRLKLLGYDVGQVDGVFDQQLGEAIKAFRADQKELPDGRTALSEGVDKSIRQEVHALHHDAYRAREKRTGARVRLDRLTGQQAASGIQQGDKGRAVANVQAHLRAAGFDPKATSGRFDERTRGMVEAFQREAGLPVTGEVDAKTWSELQGAVMLAKSDTSPAQAVGERSHAVHHTENLLRKLGYQHVKADGTFDAHTQAAVRAFEKKHHLHVDGQVDGRDLKSMEKAVKNLWHAGSWHRGPGQLKGGDFSAYQSDATFQAAIKNAKWASVKATEGTDWTDPTFKQRWAELGQRVKSGKMKLRMAYCFLHAGNGVAQAKHFLSACGIHGKLPAGTRLALDWEADALNSPGTLREAANYVHKVTGVWPLVYCSASQVSRARAAVPKAYLWEAAYGSGISRSVPFFQYSDGPGYDHDVFNGNLDALERFAGWK